MMHLILFTNNLKEATYFNVGRDYFHTHTKKSSKHVHIQNFYFLHETHFHTKAFQVLLHYYYIRSFYIIIRNVVVCRNNKNQQYNENNTKKFK